MIGEGMSVEMFDISVHVIGKDLPIMVVAVIAQVLRIILCV